MSLILMLILQATAPPYPGPIEFDLGERGGDGGGGKVVSISEIGSRCLVAEEGDTVVVCGRDNGRYRLPLPGERETAVGPVRGEAPSAAAVLAPSGRCGIFAGEHSCSKAEAAQYGYGDGRDPITLLLALGGKLVDPDADNGPAAKGP